MLNDTYFVSAHRCRLIKDTSARSKVRYNGSNNKAGKQGDSDNVGNTTILLCFVHNSTPSNNNNNNNKTKTEAKNCQLTPSKAKENLLAFRRCSFSVENFHKHQVEHHAFQCHPGK